MKTRFKGFVLPLILIGGCSIYTPNLLEDSPSSAGSSGASLGGGGNGGGGTVATGGASHAGSSGTVSQGGTNIQAGGAGGMHTNQPTVADWLHVDGNQILHEDGTPFLGHGVNIFDPRQCGACAWTNPGPVVDGIKRRIDLLTDTWHANFLGLNLTSYASNMANGLTLPQWDDVLGDAGYADDLATIVNYIGTKPGVYVMIAIYEHPSLDAHRLPTDATLPVWKKLSSMFKDLPYVMYATALDPNGDNGNASKSMNDVILAIRGEETKPNWHLVAGTGLSPNGKPLEPYFSNPLIGVDSKNIVYTVSVGLGPDTYHDLFISPSEYLPVIIEKFGPNDFVQPPTTVDNMIELMQQAEDADISYLGWAFSQGCVPRMLNFRSGDVDCTTDPPLDLNGWGIAMKNHLTTLR